MGGIIGHLVRFWSYPSQKLCILCSCLLSDIHGASFFLSASFNYSEKCNFFFHFCSRYAFPNVVSIPPQHFFPMWQFSALWLTSIAEHASLNLKGTPSFFNIFLPWTAANIIDYLAKLFLLNFSKFVLLFSFESFIKLFVIETKTLKKGAQLP